MTATIGTETTESVETGAPSNLFENGDHGIWTSLEKQVKRLQVRIAKATREGRWNKVKVLQRLLTRSFAAKALAVRRVTGNRGKRTPGVDGRIWSTPASKRTAITRLGYRGYQPRPLRRLYIPKSNGKKRPLGIPTMHDRAMQALEEQAVQPVAEAQADPHSYGYRPNRSTADAIEQCFCTLSRRNSAQWILEGDIRGCFDNISHAWLLQNIPMDKRVLKQWLEAGYLEDGTLHSTVAGSPQGGIISPVLANMTLDGLETAVKAALPKGQALRRSKVNVIRYADDFVITGCTQALLEQCIKPAVIGFLAERGLALAEEKTQIVHIDQGFDFLGKNLRKYGGKLLIKPSRKSTKTVLDKVRNIIRQNKTAQQANLIYMLNPTIRGWAQHHRHVVAKDIFNQVDQKIWQCLWRWAKRRHPHKGARWVLKRYFHSIGNRQMVFAHGKSSHQGFIGEQLFCAAKVTIKRHVKVISQATAHDPQWVDYFAKRKQKYSTVELPGFLRGC